MRNEEMPNGKRQNGMKKWGKCEMAEMEKKSMKKKSEGNGQLSKCSQESKLFNYIKSPH